MTDSQAYVAFNLSADVGFARVSELAAVAGSVSAAWEAYPNKVSRTGGGVDWEREYELAEARKVKILTPADEGYPARLLSAPGRPLALYVRGDVAALSKPFIALVGTRRPTEYGLRTAGSLAAGLAQSGWGVLSGLALGIDAASHRGALDVGGLTVGIIGSGLDRFYPEENIDLARDVVDGGGAVVSEFPFGRPPDRETFPIRNHVVAALAQGIVAVEAPARSGTLITTSAAADLGRTVMAVPGRVDSRASAGCHQLIRDGAILVRDVDDILEAMSELFPRSSRTAANTAPEKDPDVPAYSPEEALVMLHVERDGVSLDELARKTGLPASSVNAVVMGLRIKGFVKFLPGNRVAQAGSGRR